MFRLGIIEESFTDRSILNDLSNYFVSQRIQKIPEDEFPVWHTNEYHVDASEIENLVDKLKDTIKETWYCHAFNDEKLYVVMCRKWFEISIEKDETWNDMIQYGVEQAKVDREYLENIPLNI